jgi:phage FluMu protein Com
MNTLSLDEHRCKCGKLLLKGVFFDGTVEIKCKRCGIINSVGYSKSTDDDKNYLLIFGNNDTVINASDSACRVLDYARHELIGKHFTQINPVITEEAGRKYFSALNEDNYFRLDTIQRSKNGKSIPIIAYLKLHQSVVDERNILFYAKLKSDECQQSLTKEKESEQLGIACDFCFDVDEKGVILQAVESCEKLLGIGWRDSLTKNFLDINLDDSTQRKKETFKHFSASKLPFREVHVVEKDNRDNRICTELYFTPMFSDTGKFFGYTILGWIVKEVHN